MCVGRWVCTCKFDDLEGVAAKTWGGGGDRVIVHLKHTLGIQWNEKTGRVRERGGEEGVQGPVFLHCTKRFG